MAWKWWRTVLDESFSLTREDLLDPAGGKIKCFTNANDWAYAEYPGNVIWPQGCALAEQLSIGPCSRWY